MMKAFFRLAAIAIAILCASSAIAQSPNAGRPVIADTGFVPAVSVYCDDGTGKAALCPFGAGDTSAAPGSDSAKATGVQGVGGGKPIAVLDLDQMSTARAASYSVGTGTLSIPANQVLNVVFTCGAPAGKQCHIYVRRIGNPGTAALQYQNFRSPTAITGGTTKVAGNKLVGGPATTTAITYATGSTAIATGTPAITDYVYPGGDTLIPYMTTLQPGGTFGVTISGISGALASAAPTSVLFIEYEGAL